MSKVSLANVAADASERELQRAVVDYARRHQWRTFQFPNARAKSEAGWPDLIAIRGDDLLAVELKSRVGRIRPAQSEVMALLRGVRNLEAMIIRPADVDVVAAVLSAEGV